MADTALKFGPEWLRALTEPQGEGGGVLYTPPLPNMKLADYRYGREEMLALFDKSTGPPEDLAQFGTLFVEKCQFPLNLMQMTEEETRAWQRGANSDASLRPYGAGAGKRPPSPSGGRGRGRGRGTAPYYDRNRSMDDEQEGGRRGLDGPSAERGFPRGAPRNGFDRQSSERGGGGWFDRQQSRDEETNGGVSPRKGYTRAPFDDWRRGGEGGDGGAAPGAGGAGEEGWRTSGAGRRWGGAGTGLGTGQGWRAGDRENNHAGRPNAERRPGGGDRWRREGEGGAGRHRGRPQDLPEWATDDPSEGGTFDELGKFKAEQQRNGVERADWGQEEGSRWEDEEVDPEDLAGPLPEKPTKEVGQPLQQQTGPVVEVVNQEVGRGGDDSPPSSWDSVPSPSGEESAPREVPPVVPAPVTAHVPLPAPADPGAHMENMAGNLVASLVDDEEVPRQVATGRVEQQQPVPPPTVPSPPPPSWSYLDPQGQVQGPFQPEEMLEWFTAGYFPADLMVRRSCDQRFTSLTELRQLYGRVPFTPGPAPPPLPDTQQQALLAHQQQLMMQQQLLAQQQQQQMLAMQQQAAASGHSPDLGKLLQFGGGGGHHPQLGQFGLGGAGRPDPRPGHHLLGGLPSMPDPPADPLQQLLARNQAGPAMPGLGRGFQHSPPPPVISQAPPPPQPQDRPGPFQQSLFGLAGGPSKPVSTSPPAPAPTPGFDPIQSLLAQLAGGVRSEPDSPQLARPGPPPEPHRPPQSIWDLPASEPEPVRSVPQDKPLPSIWNDCGVPPSPPAAPAEPAPAPAPAPAPSRHSPPHEFSQSDNQQEMPSTEQRERSESPSFDQPSDLTDPASFVKPKLNEKKDKKTKRTEEKRRAKEAKRVAEQAGPYIPGMSGTGNRPEEQLVATANIMDMKEEEKVREAVEAQQRQKEQMEALVKLQREQETRLAREEQMRIQQEKLAKLAPWAKKETSPVKEGGSAGLTLQEIQRLEAERDRAERQAREIQDSKLREEHRRQEEEDRQRRAAKTINWATAAAPAGGKVKSLAEIQAEEARVEKERQDRENAARSVRSQQTGASSGSIWGGGTKANMSWAGKIAANTPTPPAARANGNQWASSNGQSTAAVVAPAGFWDPVLPEQPVSNQQQQQPNKKSNSKNKKKKVEEEQKVKQIFNEKQKPKNDFEDWCSKALQGLQAQVDIPTFLGFLMDIESPYEVHDYVKSYVGEGKAQKKFAMDYLERRSRWKNSLKSGAKYEDDLTTPANALTPGEGEFQEAGKKGKKTKLTKQSKSKQDISHLLGFSVTGQGVNRGELDMPQ